MNNGDINVRVSERLNNFLKNAAQFSAHPISYSKSFGVISQGKAAEA
jgi:hypothetical protein